MNSSQGAVLKLTVEIDGEEDDDGDDAYSGDECEGEVTKAEILRDYDRFQVEDGPRQFMQLKGSAPCKSWIKQSSLKVKRVKKDMKTAASKKVDKVKKVKKVTKTAIKQVKKVKKALKK